MKKKLLSITLALTILFAPNISNLSLGDASALSTIIKYPSASDQYLCVSTECVININSLPDKVTYNIGDELDLTGLKVSATYYPGGDKSLNQLMEEKETIASNENPLESEYLDVDTSEFDSSKPGEYNIKISLSDAAKNKWCDCPAESFSVTVTDENTENTEESNTDVTSVAETETTIISIEMVEAEPVCYMKVVSNPDKTVYNIGDEIDLSGLKINVLYAPGGEMPISQLNNFKTVIDSANPLDDDHFIVDTSEFDSSQVGSYNIKISLTNEASSSWWYCQSIYIPVTVMDKNTEITGDANGDNTFNIADVIALNKYILNNPNITISNANAVDLNSDGQVNVIDLCLMKNMLISQNNTLILQ